MVILLSGVLIVYRFRAQLCRAALKADTFHFLAIYLLALHRRARNRQLDATSLQWATT
jgi:hypothetical protein